MQPGEEFRADGRAARRLDPAALDELTRLSTWRGALAPALTVGAVAMLAVAGAWAWAAGQWGWLLLLVPLMAGQQHALFILAHEAAHYRLFPQRALNEAVGCLAGWMAGLSMRTYRVTHRLHHNHLYGPQDPDIALHGGYPRGEGYLLRKLLIDLSGRTAPKTAAYFLGAPAADRSTGQALRPLDDTSARLRAQAQTDRRLLALWQLAAPMACALAGGATGLLLYALLWLLPWATVLQALLRLRAVAEHGAPGALDSPLQAARSNRLPAGPLGWLLRAMLFPHHVNHHLEHHLYPAVPHYRLPALHRALQAQGLLQGAEVRPLRSTLARVTGPRPGHG